MTALPQLIHRYNAVPVKIPAGFFTENDRLILKFIGYSKDPEKNKVRRLNISGFQNLLQSNSNQENVVVEQGHI